MKKRTIRNLVLYSSLVTLLFIGASIVRRKKNELNSIRVEEGKIEYLDKTIYIGDEDYLKNCEIKDNTIRVLDKRNDADPNLKVYDSYKIKDPKDREEIIDCLLRYEEEYDTPWDRTKISLTREWDVHNYLYELGYEILRTKDVDFNNKDEKTYRIRENLLKR